MIDRKDLDDDGFTLEILIEETKLCFTGVICEPEISSNLLIEVIKWQNSHNSPLTRVFTLLQLKERSQAGFLISFIISRIVHRHAVFKSKRNL